MSVKRRLAAAAPPGAGVTVVAALLAMSGQPASAAPAERVGLGLLRETVAAGSAFPGAAFPGRAMVECDSAAAVNIANQACEPAGDADGATGDRRATGGGRGHAGYGDDDEAPDDDYGGGDGTPGDDGAGDDDGSPADDDGPIRGNDGYGGVDESPSPEAPPSETPPGETPPGGETPEVPPGGVSPAEAPGEGEGAGDTLPVTGGPVVLLGALGGLLTAGGLALRVALRRCRA